MNGLVAGLLVFVVALALRALFAGYETGFVSTNPIRIRFLAEEEHERRAARFMRYAGNPDQMLSMLLLGTNCATIIGTMAVTRCAVALSEPYGELITPFLVTPLFLIFTEIIPKSAFRTHANHLSLSLLPVIRVFYVLAMPVAAPVAWLSRKLFRTSAGERRYLSPLMTSRDDVRVLVDESAQHGTIEPEEQEMIHSVINLQAKQAKEIMVPRIDVQALPDTATREELLALFEETGRTRVPVYRDTIDAVAGVVNAHDVLLDTEPEKQDITRFIHEIPHVPDTVNLDDLFQTLKQSKQHMAIVTDEYGGTDGLITIEDILEEIFGEIQDEHDEEESPLVQVGPNAYIVDARMPVEDMAKALNAMIEDEEIDTVGGWLMHVAGRIPAQGEVVQAPGFRMTVLEGGPSYVAKVRLDLVPKEADDDADEA